MGTFVRVSKVGPSSRMIVIPKEIADLLSISVGDTLELELAPQGDGLWIRKVASARPP